MLDGGIDRYKAGKELAESGTDCVALVVAAMLTGSDEAAPLQKAYPVLWEEVMLRRFMSADGSLPGDQQAEIEPGGGYLGRD